MTTMNRRTQRTWITAITLAVIISWIVLGTVVLAHRGGIS